jgi:hypothetical protein
MGKSQVETYKRFLEYEDLQERYEKVFEFADQIYYFGRFTLFNYLEALSQLTNLKMEPTGLELENAESCRNGLCYACNKEEFVTLHGKKPIKPINYDYLYEKLEQLMTELREETNLPVSYWNVETALCAYKKLFWNTRYLGYYIDRQMKEILKLERDTVGVDWKIMWDFRDEYFKAYFLGEDGGWQGIRKDLMKIVTKSGKLYEDNVLSFLGIQFPEFDGYNKKVNFKSIGNPYKLETTLLNGKQK